MDAGTRAEAGAGCDWFAQQAGVAQLLESHPGPQQHDSVPGVFWLTPAETVTRVCQARTRPSTRATGLFRGFGIMAFKSSFRISNPCVLCPMPRMRQTFLC